MGERSRIVAGTRVVATVEIHFRALPPVPRGTRGTVVGEPGIVTVRVLFDGHGVERWVSPHEIETFQEGAPDA